MPHKPRNNDLALNSEPEMVFAFSLLVVNRHPGRIIVRGRCGKGYAMTTEDAEKFANRILDAAKSRRVTACGPPLPELIERSSITCVSGDGQPYVQIRFAKLEDAQALHRALVDLIVKAAERVDEGNDYGVIPPGVPYTINEGSQN